MSRERAALIVAGEASGDRIAAKIAVWLGARNVGCFGMGGAASAASGVDLVCDLRRTTGMGTTEIVTRIPALVSAYLRLKRVSLDRRPQAAVLVAYTEFNVRLGRWLRSIGIPVLFVVAPQVWAWRAGRMSAVARALDRMAVILPFEERLWRAAGVDAHYVGHPALDIATADRKEVRARLGIAQDAESIALLPGSRPAEVRMLAGPMLGALARLVRGGRRLDARIVVAPSLDPRTRRWLSGAAARSRVPLLDVDPVTGAMPDLAGFDACISASGTATLESALCGAPPVAVYRMNALSWVLAKRLVRTPHIALPNVLLGRRCYPELVQGDLDERRLASAVSAVLDDRPRFAQAAAELWRSLRTGAATEPRTTMADRCGGMIDDWLGT
jgi:lipid-A-disaccharide synthase